MATNINNTLACNQPHASLDSYYGPYNSVDDAFEALADTVVNGVTYSKKFIGLTVGVWKDNSKKEIVEYWFKGGLTKSNLVEKTSGGSLPGNVKIVTFDKNGGSGAQNSVITDTEGKVVLPQRTLKNGTTAFVGWSYEGNTYNEGDIVTVGTNTVVKAVWETTPTAYKVSWAENPGDGISSITAKVGNNPINSGDSVSAGTSVSFTATVDNGYIFDKWNDGNARNPRTIVVDRNISGITATAKPKLTITDNGGVAKYTVTIDGEDTKEYDESTYIPTGSSVAIEATLDDGYGVVKWVVTDGSQPQESGNTVTFTMGTLPVSVVLMTKSETGTAFSYYACQGGTGEKWFANVIDLIDASGSVTLTSNQNGILYVVTNATNKPKCNIEGTAFVDLNNCVDPDIIEYFVTQQAWVERGTNQTKGDLQQKGNLIYILISEKIKDRDVVISFDE